MQSVPKPGYQATDGAAYQVFLGRWTERFADALLGLLEIPPDGALLDVGCGTGSLAFAIADRWPGREVNGGGALSQCQRRHRRHRHGIADAAGNLRRLAQINQNCLVLCASRGCTWCWVIMVLVSLGGVQPSGRRPVRSESVEVGLIPRRRCSGASSASRSPGAFGSRSRMRS